MSMIKNNWKVLLAILLTVVSILILLLGYAPNRLEFRNEEKQMSTKVAQLEMLIAENLKYESVQDLLDPASEAIDMSRKALYQRFPAEYKEEDQIMYVLYLEEKFGTEIMFNFGTVAPIARFSDGSMLNGLSLTVNYSSTYDEFKDMINYLARDSRVTSIQYGTMEYDAENDLVTGNLTLLLYTMDSPLVDYYKPHITPSQKGKDNIFEGSVLTPEDVKNQTNANLGGNGSGSGSSGSAGSGSGSGTSGSGSKVPDNSAEGVIPGYGQPKKEIKDPVWIPTEGGTKYHSNQGCSEMENPRQVSKEEAVRLGFKPCKKC